MEGEVDGRWKMEDGGEVELRKGRKKKSWS